MGLVDGSMDLSDDSLKDRFFDGSMNGLIEGRCVHCLMV